MWDKPALLNGVANALYAAGAITALAIAVLLLARLPVFALREVAIGNELRRVARAEIEGVVQRELKGNFFTVDLSATRAAFERLPWVRRVSVRRHWPARLEVALEEHVPLARWGSVVLVNTHGEPFQAAFDGPLPVFIGPEGSTRELAIQYRYFRRNLGAVGETPVEVQVTPRRAWQLKLASGLTLALGRDSVELRLARFVELYPRTLGRLGHRVEYVDLRYANGFAVRLPAQRHEPPEPKRGRRTG